MRECGGEGGGRGLLSEMVVLRGVSGLVVDEGGERGGKAASRRDEGFG